mgnify:CR=1 FL=1
MKPSRYNHYLGFINKKHVYINGLSRKTVKLTPDEDKLFSSSNFQALKDSFPDVINYLKQYGFIYPKALDQFVLIENYLKSMQRNQTYLSATFILTRQCNFKCTYCIQGLNKTNSHLTFETADKYIKYFKNLIKSHPFEKFLITYYGGEPTLNLPVLKFLHTELNKITSGNNSEISYSLITNGYLLDKFIKEIDPSEISEFIITLDGDKKNHNERRKTADNKPSFHRIMNNLSLLPEQSVILNVNLFNKDSVSSVIKLLDILVENNLKKQIKEIHFKPILNNGKFCDYPGIIDYSDINQDLLYDCNKEALLKDFRVKEYLGGPCEYLYKHTYVLDVNGDIYKCPAMIDSPELSIGNISTFSEYPESELNSCFKNECRNCPFLPTCYGGCRFSSYLKFGDPDKVNCEVGFFNTFGLKIEQLKQIYLKGGD